MRRNVGGVYVIMKKYFPNNISEKKNADFYKLTFGFRGTKKTL